MAGVEPQRRPERVVGRFRRLGRGCFRARRVDQKRDHLRSECTSAHRQRDVQGVPSQTLPRLKDLGADILWLMPIHPIGEVNRKGGENKNNYIVEPWKFVRWVVPTACRTTTRSIPTTAPLDDFKCIDLRGPRLGMRVILDWVANHSAFDCVWTEDHKEYYLLDSTGKLAAAAGHPLGGMLHSLIGKEAKTMVCTRPWRMP